MAENPIYTLNKHNVYILCVYRTPYSPSNIIYYNYNAACSADMFLEHLVSHVQSMLFLRLVLARSARTCSGYRDFLIRGQLMSQGYVKLTLEACLNMASS